MTATRLLGRRHRASRGVRVARRAGRGPVGSARGELSTEEAGVSARAVACEPAPQGGQPPPGTARSRQEEGRGPEAWAPPPWRCLLSHRPAPTRTVSSQLTWWVWSARPNLPAYQRGPRARPRCGACCGVPRGAQGGRWLPWHGYFGPRDDRLLYLDLPTFRELITTCVWGRGCFEVGGGQACGQPHARDEGLTWVIGLPECLVWRGSCGAPFRRKCRSRVELAPAGPPRSRVALSTWGSSAPQSSYRPGP